MAIIGLKEVLDLMVLCLFISYFVYVTFHSLQLRKTQADDGLADHKVEEEAPNAPTDPLPTQAQETTTEVVAKLVEEAMKPVIAWHETFTRTDEKRTSALEANHHAIITRQKMFEQVTDKNLAQIRETQTALETRIDVAKASIRTAENKALKAQHQCEVKSLRSKVQHEKSNRQKAEAKCRSLERDLEKALALATTQVESLRDELEDERRQRQQAERDMAVKKQAIRKTQAALVELKKTSIKSSKPSLPQPAKETVRDANNEKISRHAVATFRLKPAEPKKTPIPESITLRPAASDVPSLDDLADLLSGFYVTWRKGSYITQAAPLVPNSPMDLSEPHTGAATHIQSQEPIVLTPPIQQAGSRMNQEDKIVAIPPTVFVAQPTVADATVQSTQPFIFKASSQQAGSCLTQTDKITLASPEASVQQPVRAAAEIQTKQKPFFFDAYGQQPGSWMAQAEHFAPKKSIIFAEPPPAIATESDSTQDIDMPPALDEISLFGEPPAASVDDKAESTAVADDDSILYELFDAPLDEDDDMLYAADENSTVEEAFGGSPDDAEQTDVEMPTTIDELSVVGEMPGPSTDSAVENDIGMPSPTDPIATAQATLFHTQESLQGSVAPAIAQQHPADAQQEEKYDKWGVLIVPHVPVPEQEESEGDQSGDTLCGSADMDLGQTDSDDELAQPGGMQGGDLAARRLQSDSDPSGSDPNSCTNANTGKVTVLTSRPMLKMPVGKKHRFSKEQIARLKVLDAEAATTPSCTLFSSDYLARLRSHMADVDVLNNWTGHADEDDEWAEQVKRGDQSLGERAFCDISEETRHAVAPYTVQMLHDMMEAFFVNYVWDAVNSGFELVPSEMDAYCGDYMKLVQIYMEEHPADARPTFRN